MVSVPADLLKYQRPADRTAALWPPKKSWRLLAEPWLPPAAELISPCLNICLPRLPDSERWPFLLYYCRAALGDKSPQEKLQILINAHGIPMLGTRSYQAKLRKELRRVPAELHEKILLRMLYLQYARERAEPGAAGFLDAGAHESARAFVAEIAHYPLHISINASDDSIINHAKLLASVAAGIAHRRGDVHSYALSHGVAFSKNHNRLARILDPIFWRQEIRRTLRRHRESVHLRTDPALLHRVSNWGLNESLGMNARHDNWLAAHEIANEETGEIRTLPDLQTIAKHRYARLYRIAEAVAQQAAEDGAGETLTGTITLPSRFHATTTAAGPRCDNPHYDLSSPRDGIAFFNKCWERFRRAAQRADLLSGYVLSIEPHADETPHWHCVFWTRDARRLDDLLREHFYRRAEPNLEDADGGGRRIKTKICDDPGHALAYAAKMVSYPAKTLAGDAEETAFYDEAERAQAWARTWGVRRIRFSKTRASIYDMLRRFDPEKYDGAFRDAIAHARAGNVYAAVRTADVSPVYETTQNRYGEPSKRFVGLSFAANDDDAITARVDAARCTAVPDRWAAVRVMHSPQGKPGPANDPSFECLADQNQPVHESISADKQPTGPPTAYFSGIDPDIFFKAFDE